MDGNSSLGRGELNLNNCMWLAHIGAESPLLSFSTDIQAPGRTRPGAWRDTSYSAAPAYFGYPLQKGRFDQGVAGIWEWQLTPNRRLFTVHMLYIRIYYVLIFASTSVKIAVLY